MTGDACLIQIAGAACMAWLNTRLPQHNPLTTNTNWSRTSHHICTYTAYIYIFRFKYLRKFERRTVVKNHFVVS